MSNDDKKTWEPRVTTKPIETEKESIQKLFTPIKDSFAKTSVLERIQSTPPSHTPILNTKSTLQTLKEKLQNNSPHTPTPSNSNMLKQTNDLNKSQKSPSPLFQRPPTPLQSTPLQKSLPASLQNPSPLQRASTPQAASPLQRASTNVINAKPLSFKERFEELNRKQEEKKSLPISTQKPLETKPLFSLNPPINTTINTEKTMPLFPTAKKETSNSFAQPTGKFDIKITDEEFLLLRDFLYSQCGIFVAENRKYLMDNRLGARLHALGLHNFGEYHNYLRFDKNRMDELNILFEHMTTNETSFFRNNPQLDIFKDKVLTRVINEQKAKGSKILNIWSAGCSSGEEPYTISIILHELLGADISNWRIKITANDLSLPMLETARKALYSEYVMRTTPAPMLQKYFTKEGNLYKIAPKIQSIVQFSQINLANKLQLARIDRSHIIFCRNVIIYFDDEMKKHVINAFYDNLLPGGSLLIGHSESLHNISRAFKPEHHTGGIVYYKQH